MIAVLRHAWLGPALARIVEIVQRQAALVVCREALAGLGAERLAS